MALDFAGVCWLSFDCYGTLIDWEAGILRAVRPLLERRGVRAADEEILERYARAEAQLEAGEYLRYRDVLAGVMMEIAAEFGFVATEEERALLAESVQEWSAFADTPGAMRRLKDRFRLAVLSNVDDDLFAGTAGKLGVKLDALVTAEHCRSYKPARRNFEILLEKTGARRGQLVHVAQSLYHDVAPAREMGIATVWVNRRAGRAGGGATPESGAVPDLQVPDLATLARLAAGSA